MFFEGAISGIETKTDDIISNINDFYRIRGYEDVISANDFYTKATYEINRYDSFLLKDAEPLVNRMLDAYDNNENILIFGDFDMDGISSTAVVMKGLKYLGYKNINYLIPNRRIGYSIRGEYIDNYLNEGNTKPDLIMTVDCGIRSIEDIDYIQNELGIDVIVTDHHLPFESVIPNAVAVVDPHRSDCNYPFKMISGSFVALKVMEMLMSQLDFVDGPMGNPSFAWKELQELATLGTISDVMPILDENALLVKSNLINYHISQNLGIRMMSEFLLKGKLKNYDNDTKLVGFGLGPLINAAGRIGDPNTGLKILLSDNRNEVENLYTKLYTVNEKRKEISKEGTEKAIDFLDTNGIYNKGIVYVDAELNEGIIGLVAGRIKERYFRPTLVVGSAHEDENGNIIYKASGRSVEGVNIYEIINELGDLLLGYGGHAGACGMSIKEENLEDFINGFYNICNNIISDDVIIPRKICDGMIKVETITESFINNLRFSGPYGHMNQNPTFLLLGKIEKIDFPRSKKDENKIHMYINLVGNDKLKCQIWNISEQPELFELAKQLKPGMEIGLYGVPEINEWKGVVSLKFQFEDITVISV